MYRNLRYTIRRVSQYSPMSVKMKKERLHLHQVNKKRTTVTVLRSYVNKINNKTV